MPRDDSIYVRSYRVRPRGVARKAVPNVRGRLGRSQARYEPAFAIRRPGSSRVLPEGKSLSGLCKPHKEGRGIPECFIRLEFVGTRRSERFGVKPGAYLVSCTGAKKPGYAPTSWIPVKGPAHARTVAERFCDCRDAGGSTERCARTVGGVPGSKPKGRKRR